VASTRGAQIEGSKAVFVTSCPAAWGRDDLQVTARTTLPAPEIGHPFRRRRARLESFRARIICPPALSLRVLSTTRTWRRLPAGGRQPLETAPRPGMS